MVDPIVPSETSEWQIALQQMLPGDSESALSFREIMANVLDALDNRQYMVEITAKQAADVGVLGEAWVQCDPQPCAEIVAPLVLWSKVTKDGAAWYAGSGRLVGLRREINQWVDKRAAQQNRIVDEASLSEALKDWGSFQLNDDQKLAVSWALGRSFAVLTGGPGTGKTTSVTRLLIGYLCQNPDLCADDIALLAPTGKAASRLADTLRRQTAHLREQPHCNNLADLLESVQPKTLHRALGWTPVPVESGGPWRHNAQRPLSAKVVLVDECSMVDLDLFAALTRAINPEAQVILLGDRHQLDSVEVGGVLAELLQKSSFGRQAEDMLSIYASRAGVSLDDELCERHMLDADEGQSSPLAGVSFTLHESRRFKDDTPLGCVAFAIRTRLESNAQYQWQDVKQTVMRHLDKTDLIGTEATVYDAQACQHIAHHYQPLRQCVKSFHARQTAEQLRALFLPEITEEGSQLSPPLERFALLCALRRGLGGVDAWNQHMITNWLGVRESKGELPHGCPLMIVRNDAATGLSNGDVGFALALPDDSAMPQPVATHGLFMCQSEVILRPLSLLPKYEPCFATTIHKSQGSEWDQVCLALPNSRYVPSSEDSDSFLSARLLYTALTRARHSVSMLGAT